MSNILIIIPARGGSKGIPRKNLRALNGKPLIYYSINTALSLDMDGVDVDVYVSSEDKEILTLSQKFGAKVHERSANLSQDATTLDGVIHDAYKAVSAKEGKEYDLIVTAQPTSPLLSVGSLESALKQMIHNKNLDTLISAKEDRHLSWAVIDGQLKPKYKERLNRQELPMEYRETGGFLICRSTTISENSRIGSNVEVFELKGREAIDIDDFGDWNLCEFYLRQKRILFVISGYKEIGMGHVYNALSIANEILNHEVIFLTDAKSQLAHDKIAENNYTVHLQSSENIADDIIEFNADVIISDRLDTDNDYMSTLKGTGAKLINFEDLGEGARHADVVINAMYPELEEMEHHYYGSSYFILRDEFLFAPFNDVRDSVSNVLLCFGGVDPNNFTNLVLRSIHEYCQNNNISISVITGMGYQHLDALNADYPDVTCYTNVSDISEHMLKADLVFTSAGRTTFEVAALGTPAIVLCQNKRETTHFFAWDSNGFKNLGLGENVTEEQVFNTFTECILSGTRKEMHDKMMATNLREGKKNVLQLIRNLIG